MPCLLGATELGTDAREDVVMATHMKSVLGSVLLIVILAGTGMHLVVADPETPTVWNKCGESGNYTNTNGSAFQLNLNKLLDSLVTNVYATGFNTSSIVAEGPNVNSTVYGLVHCRGDLSSSDFKQCASMAKANLVRACHNTSGFIQLDGCFLHYDNHKFYNDIESTKETPSIIICKTGNNSQPQQFTDAIKARFSNITLEAAQSPKIFAADTAVEPSTLTGIIYSLAQCWRDLSRTSCESCLTYALENIFKCQPGALGAQFRSQNCYLRYEVYAFFHNSVIWPPPAESSPVSSGIFFTYFTMIERNKSRTIAIILSVVAVCTFGLIAAMVNS